MDLEGLVYVGVMLVVIWGLLYASIKLGEYVKKKQR